jgi:hypothetical protein
MIIRPLRLELTDEERSFFKSTSHTRYQFTIGKDYTVYAMEFVPSSVTDFTLYRVVTDFNAFVPAPACLFEIVDPRVSSYWRITHNRKNFGVALEPPEFIDDPGLSEAILDRDPQALTIFRAIRMRMDAE